MLRLSAVGRAMLAGPAGQPLGHSRDTRALFVSRSWLSLRVLPTSPKELAAAWASP